MKRLEIDFRANFVNCDSEERICGRMKNSNEIEVMRLQINHYLNEKLRQAQEEEKKERDALNNKEGK